MAAEADELDERTRVLCRRLVGRLDLRARRATVEIVIEDGEVKELFRHERFQSVDLDQFDQPQSGRA